MLKKIYQLIQIATPHARGLIHSLMYFWVYKKLGRGVRIWANTHIRNKDCIALGNNVTIPFGCFISPLSLTVGANSWLGVNAFICGRVSIGSNVAIGPGVVIPGASHSFRGNRDIVMTAPLEVIGTVIKDGAWIGGNAVIIDGVTIGEGAVIGAGAVVTKNVPPFSIAVGNPARVIGCRDDNSFGSNSVV